MAAYLQHDPRMRAVSATMAGGSARLRLGSWLVLASATFNIALCFIKTRHWAPVANPEIVLTEILILTTGLAAIGHRVAPRVIQLVGLMVVFMIGLKLINPALDLKILHDLGIMYIFYKLGTATSPQQANRLVWLLMGIVLTVGVFELLFTTAFGNVFDVWSYYLDKGVIAQGTVNYSGTNLYLSGDRGAAARTFFPGLLGSHRISSVFLEPDSLGNYAAIMFAWCVSAAIGSRWKRNTLLSLSVFCFVLADSRFGAGCCALMLVFSLTPLVRSRLLIFVLPVLVLLALTIAGSLNELRGTVPAIMSDNFAGRLLFSGRLLNYWHLPQWLGLVPSQVYTADTGYAYVINNLGLPLALLFLGMFAMHPPARREAMLMKAMIVIYISTSLCIGASIFTIKTAALLWFLYGVANAPAVVLPRGRAGCVTTRRLHLALPPLQEELA